MGDYGGDDRDRAPRGGYFHWPLLIGAMLLGAAIYAVFPSGDSGPNSVTVIGVTAPRPAFGSYPGLRVPVTRPTQTVADYRT